MSRFQLDIPAGQYEGRILADCANAEMTIPGVGVIRVPVDAVTQVVPPLPPEPPVGSLVTIEWRTDDGMPVREVWERTIPYWWQLDTEDLQRIGRGWDELHARGRVTVFVPDPVADAPALPCVIEDEDGETIHIEPSDRLAAWVTVGGEPRHLNREQARQAAAALWRAAAVHEQPEER